MTTGRTRPNRRSTSGSTQPQYPTPTAAGVGYYKLLARTCANRQPQTHGTTRRERNLQMTPHKRKPQGGPIQPAIRAGVQGPSTHTRCSGRGVLQDPEPEPM
ncbi:hypothetical protein BS47DRAFT_1368272 [Hydnum rufescens UP504]|uniref:Uncharacterized protein n=1 Tax=Hydnum rufescens UP504 TaxID=1448309 RepID=A0A9P6AHU4_9AGAM|nr:hypothetical protein BS47DRAFT_1368272 [Hydnum rufescens UP504]